MNKKRLLVLTGIVLMAWVGAAQAADLKIGCVDVQRIASESNFGKEAGNAMNKEVERVTHLDVEKQKEIQNLQDSMEKQSPMLTPDARNSRQKEYQNKVREYQRWKEDTGNELNQKAAEMERKIVVDLKKITDKIGAEEGFTLIIVKNESVVFYASKTIDITDRVIKVLDASKK